VAAVQRPNVDVVIPFAGPQAELDQLLAHTRSIRMGTGDTLTVVDNRAQGEPSADERVVAARERRSSYHARNQGAARGGADWIVFVDADVEPAPDLLDRYFAREPDWRTAVLAGGVVDEPIDPASGRSAAARYAHLKGRMGQANTLRSGEWGYAQTANCAVRRSAFEAVDGFRDEIRSAGDADLCYRLRRAGWELEERPEATVVHRSRRTLRSMLRQRLRHGSGIGWLEREYPGSFPRKNPLGLAKWSIGSLARAILLGMQGKLDAALVASIEPFEVWALEIGRMMPNTTRRRS
jgi:glycosyltransferase involved in cell wall biosynthesis